MNISEITASKEIYINGKEYKVTRVIDGAFEAVRVLSSGKLGKTVANVVYSERIKSFMCANVSSGKLGRLKRCKVQSYCEHVDSLNM